MPNLLRPQIPLANALLRVPRAAWAMADQAIVSLGNFGTTAILANHLPPDEWGRFGLLLETLLFINSLQAALVIYPLSIRAASSNQQAQLGRWASTSLTLTALLQPLLATGMFIAALVAAQWQTAVVAVFAMVCWQAQETTRRSLMAGLRFAAAILGDVLSYGGQCLCIILLQRLGWLDLQATLLAMALTSLAAAGVQALQLPLRSPVGAIAASARDFWSVGRWMLAANVTGLAILSCNFWTLRYFHGYEAVGAFAAISIFMRITHPLISGISSVLVPSVARVAEQQGFQGTQRVVYRYGSIGLMLLGPYLSVIMLLPEWSISILLRQRADEYTQYAPALRVFAINYCVYYVATMLGAWAAGMGQSRIGFISQLVNGILTLAVALPLVIWLGVPGIIYGGLVAISGTAITSLLLVLRLSKYSTRTAGAPVAL